MSGLFRFQECIPLIRLTGRRASDIIEFLDILRTISAESIFHHLHQYFIKPGLQAPEYPNDFAVWAVNSLEEKNLAERLANINPFSFSSIENLRAEIIRIVEMYLKEFPPPRRVVAGDEFFFNESVTIIVPAGIEVDNLEDFATAIQKVGSSSIYFHFFEARLRLGKKQDDFSYWLETSLGRNDIADEIRGIDPYMFSLEELRARFVDIVRKGT